MDLAFFENLITNIVEENIVNPDPDYGIVEGLRKAGYVIMRVTEKESAQTR